MSQQFCGDKAHKYKDWQSDGTNPWVGW